MSTEADGRRTLGEREQRLVLCSLPKLTAMAVDSMSGRDFAAMLDKAIARSRGDGRNVPQIELSAEPDDGRWS
jgi:hypothetical protein